MTQRCPFCGTVMKQLLLSFYCPNEDKHNVKSDSCKLKFIMLKNTTRPGLTFIESDPPPIGHWQRYAFEHYQNFGDLITGYNEDYDVYAYIYNMEDAVNQGYVKVL
ncbi:MAG TPA: hypothetical protein VMW10_03680 [Alphaproteobacteria bacterium]|nr:hypothetical protein [Alphaproteobacteria bacterium]